MLENFLKQTLNFFLMTNSTITQDFCIAFAERTGIDVPKTKDLTIDGDWLFHFDKQYPDEMDIYQYPLADMCCEVYDTCTIEEFNDPKQRQEVIDKLDASIDAAIDDYYTGEPPLSADERWQQAYDQKMEAKG